ncbi:hypothetical protein [Enterococcus sp. AZ103]|uniref:hypothetical protein n=1 Tax=Enterococcus sp. AZ103 TaxID=2774628 RepID=UPI003F21F1BE
MAKGWGTFYTAVPSDIGQQFSTGEEVWITYNKNSEKVTIVRMLVNSAIVHFDNTSEINYDHINNRTVISYSKLHKV